MDNRAKRIITWLGIGLFASTLMLSFLNYEIPDILIHVDLIFCVGSFGLYTYTQKILPYVLKRIFGAASVLLIIATLTFALVRFLPGGPFDQEKTLPPEIIANIEAKYHLDKPLVTQYFLYLKGIVTGDLGESYKYIGRNVSDIIAETLPNTFQLGIFALVISFLIGIPLGVFAAANHNTWKDNAMMIFAISGVSLPSFLVAAIMVMYFSIELRWLPPALWEGTEYYILPMIALGTRPAAVIARLTRASVLEVIQSDYIRTARAKGLSERVILFVHVLKNSLIPVLTFSGPLISGILTGSFIIEHIFAIPGMAKHLIQSVSNRDYPLILGVTLLFSAVLVIANLIVDLLYSFFDPRIKIS